MFIFELNAGQYKKACRLRMRKYNRFQFPGLASYVMAVLVFGVDLLIKADLFFFLLPVIILAFGVFETSMVNSSLTREFVKEPFLHSKQKCTLGEKGITLQNSFERIFTSYGDIYEIKNTRRYLLVLLSYRKGIIFLDKKKQKEEAQLLLSQLKKEGII